MDKFRYTRNVVPKVPTTSSTFVSSSSSTTATTTVPPPSSSSSSTVTVNLATTVSPPSSSSSSTVTVNLATSTISNRTGLVPYISGTYKGKVGKYRDRFSAVCRPCFDHRTVCFHYPELPLRCLVIGHNPSEHAAFTSGYGYSNPSNNFWPLLRGTFGTTSPSIKLNPYQGLVPSTLPIEGQDWLPFIWGTGFTELGVDPGNDAASYSSTVLQQWRQELFASLEGNMQRIRQTLDVLIGHAVSGVGPSNSLLVSGNHSSSSTASRTPSTPYPWLQRLSPSFASQICLFVIRKRNPSLLVALPSSPSFHQIIEFLTTIFRPSLQSSASLTLYGSPDLIAFSGKAQWKALFDRPLTSVETGLQSSSLRPPHWPYSRTTPVFVLPSSSGRAAFTLEQRRQPYIELAQLFHQHSWLPLDIIEALEIESNRFHFMKPFLTTQTSINLNNNNVTNEKRNEDDKNTGMSSSTSSTLTVPITSTDSPNTTPSRRKRPRTTSSD